MFNKSTIQTSNKTQLIRPLDWGFRLALRNIPAIIILAIISAAIKISLVIIDDVYHFSDRESLLLAMLSLGIAAWSLLSGFLLLASQLKHSEQSLKTCAIKALGSLPKILLSCVAIGVISGGLIQFIWPSFLLVFLIWAPLFCAAELLVKEEKPKPKKLIEDEQDLDLELEEHAPPSFFKRMPVWNLGLSRSIALMSNRRAFVLGLQIILFSMALIFSGPALIMLFLGDPYSFKFNCLEAISSCLSLSFANFVYCGTFFYLLPKEARKEIELNLDTEEKAPRLRIQGKPFALLLAIILTFASLKISKDWFVKMESMPLDASVKLSQTELNPQQIIIRVELRDETNRLSWLKSDSFKLETFEGTSPPEKIETETLLPTVYRSFHDSNDKELSEEEAIPSKTPITLSLHFENRLREKQDKSGFALVYSPSKLVSLANNEDKQSRVLTGQIGENK